MKLGIASIFAFSLLVYTSSSSVGGLEDLSARQIVDSSLQALGGIKRIDSVDNTNMIFELLSMGAPPGNLVEMRDVGRKYTQSVLMTHSQSYSLFYIGAELTRVEGRDVVSSRFSG